MSETGTGTFEGKTAAEWRAEASGSLRAREESWDRSDSDGFMTQWAHQQMAQRYYTLATLAENDGRRRMHVPMDLATGELIKGEWRGTQYGSGWAPFAGGKWIFPSQARKATTAQANDAKKGVKMAWAWVPMKLNHRSYEVFPDRDGEWVVDDTESAYEDR